MKRYTASIDPALPILAIDLGYSAKMPSCGFTHSGTKTLRSLRFGDVIGETCALLKKKGPHLLILEAVLSTYHGPDGNPDIRGDFEKGRGWYYGPGVSTYAAAIRFLAVLDAELPPKIAPIPLVEGFLSFKKTRSQHSEDARRLLSEFQTAERFHPRASSEAISPQIEGLPVILRYNAPK
ncbi:MAG: hypothetical protein GVY36_15850 [Verrucomicrobia bacterium]|nr:hypothetical protein [Verrucomicrobiota bacterium]